MNVHQMRLFDTQFGEVLPISGLKLLPRARMREGVKKSVLSVCLSVYLSICPVKNFEIRTFTRLKDCCTRQWHGNLKKNNVCVPDRDQSSSLFCISSSFLFNIGIVSHFDMVNRLDIRWRPGMCWLQAHVRVHQPPRSQDSEKPGPGNEAMHPLDSVWTVDG